MEYSDLLDYNPVRGFSTGKRFRGLYSATLTPFSPDGTPNLKVIPQYADHLHKVEKLDGIFLNGTSAESLCMTTEERKKATEAWRTATNGKLDVILHVGSTSVVTAKDLAAHGASIGVDAIALTAPSYIKPTNAEYLVKYAAEVASAAPNLPFFYYHFPVITGNHHISMYDFFIEARKVIPNLRGAKYTSMDLHDFMRTVPLNDYGYDILGGYENILIAYYAAGGKGGVGISYNILGNLHRKIASIFDSGNLELARKEQQKSLEFFSLLDRLGLPLIPAHKLLTTLKTGIHLGNTRLPLPTLTSEQANRLVNELKNTAVWEELALKTPVAACKL